MRQRAQATRPDYLTTLLQAPADLALHLERRVATLRREGLARDDAELLALQEWRETTESTTL